ncbi:hypothetical protein OGAPHI_005922 [Ogataea philodendri]|uniref:UBX domain-containing protein n=1 Tax=Ogataea philodendri TaxID=1378263 RepID=A0A9P8T122_9ASCO|nr:uncharacterized protein OGAPHI_005922 [Ogataea philodendri]KAH3661744.1 hypothetical protein OGAPHI_005922 [Ogataea philodendri]
MASEREWPEWFTQFVRNERTVPLVPGSFPVVEERQPSKLHQMANNAVKYLIDGLVLFVVVPAYILLRVLGFVLLIVIGGVMPLILRLHPNRYHVIRRHADPGDMARRFIIEFDDMIGNRTLNNAQEEETGDLIRQDELMEIPRPDFLECAYSHALHFAKKDARWLVLYIHSEENQDTKSFVDDVLINPAFLQYIKDKQMLVWGGDIKDSEAFQVANQFKVTKLPFLGLLCLTVTETPTASGIQQSSPVLSMVCKIQGPTPVEKVISKFQKSYSKFNPTLQTLRAEFERLEHDRNTRQLQDQAYENSLQRDRLRRLAEAREQRAHQEQLQLAALKTQWLKWRKSTLLPEPRSGGARTAIRLPNGSRLRRNFDKTAKIEEIYAFVECCQLNDVEINDSDSLERPIGYEHRYEFQIYTVYPREVVSVDDDVAIADSQQVFPDGNLIVELNNQP